MKKTHLLLVIDDDMDDLELFAEAIRTIAPSIQCLRANDAQDALRKLTEEFLVLPDMIFLDLNMPRVSGKQCLAEIKQNSELRHIPVIIYSTSSFQKDINEAMAIGAAGFLVKPSNFNDLCRKLSDILNQEIPD